jgi:hypothetical protein
VPFSRLFSRRRVDADTLVARCAAADRLVARRSAALARASRRHLAQPDSTEAFKALEAAEELHFVAKHDHRCAHRALNRARKREWAARRLRRSGLPT